MFITDQVKAHGYEKGVQEFFQERKLAYDQLLPLSRAREDCPWHQYGTLPPDEVIEAVFAPLQENLPQLVRLLRDNCMEVLCLHAGGTWYLLYVMQMWGSDYYLWVGREPAESPRLAAEAVKAGWSLPAPLQEFYQVHHGFGESNLVYDKNLDQRFWNANCIMPAHRLKLLDWKTEGEENTLYHPGDILFFFHDGSGDFYGLTKDSGQAVYYNREEKLVEDSLAGDFFNHMDDYFSEMFL